MVAEVAIHTLSARPKRHIPHREVCVAKTSGSHFSVRRTAPRHELPFHRGVHQSETMLCLGTGGLALDTSRA